MQRESVEIFRLGRILLIILAASCLFTMYGAALDKGFLPEEIPSEQKESLLERLDVQLFYEAPPAKPIECFAVSESEFVAIGITYDPYREEESGYRPNRFVAVYNAQGEFQYGLTFSHTGGFELDWDQGNLLIYLDRSGILVSINGDGVCTDAYKVPTTQEGNAYLQTLQSSHQTRNGKEFCLEKESGTVNYSRAVVKTDSGTTIIYDATDASSQQAVWLAMYFGALLVAVVVGLIITMKRLRQARK